ncbi:MAG: GxGYxYP family putative glycoside hydrolase [Clostridium sp.]|uniref:GxGYxYP domain-containing protein n=1 Tax=Clostridium sp. TaxID=1506 RepID=UPI002FCA967A
MKKYFKLTVLALILVTVLFTAFAPRALAIKPTTSTGNFIKNTKTPSKFYVIEDYKMTKAEQTMITTLQGILSTKSKEQIYILINTQPDYMVWLKDLKKNYNIDYEMVSDPWTLLWKFKDSVSGYVLYTSFNPPSINNACSLASLKNAIVVEEAIEDRVKSSGITKSLGDCRNTDSKWAFENLWNKGLNHSTVLQINPNKPMSLRDYAISSKSLIYYEDDAKDTSLRDAIFSSMEPNSHCLGWGPDEHNNVIAASRHGVDIIAADWSYNLSALSSFQSNCLTQNNKDATKGENGVHYVTVIMSDGDNQQWMLGSNFDSKNYFGSRYKGKFNMGWSTNPSLFYLAPTVFKMYYQHSSSGKFNDNFVVSPSGNGYIFPSSYPKNELKSYTKMLSDFMGESDLKNVLILDNESFNNTKLWDNYTIQPNIQGILYLNYYIHNKYKGEIVWSNNKPVVSCRHNLWWGLESESNIISDINRSIQDGHTRINDPDSYTFIYVHAWSNTMDNISNLVTRLQENPKVRVVTPDNFMNLIKDNVPHK